MHPRNLFALTAFVATLFLALAAAPETAQACTQPPGGHRAYSVAYRTVNSEVVFIGTVTGVMPGGMTDRANIQVEQYLKGDGPTAVEVTGFGSTALCMTPVFDGMRAIFFTRREEGTDVLYANLFSFADGATAASPGNIAQVQAAVAGARPYILGGATDFAKAAQPTEVTVLLDWTPNTNHLGLYAAQALGFYAEANLTVNIQQPGDVSVDQLVAAGTAQFGVSYQESVTYSRANGLPVVSVAAIIQHNTSGFATLSEKKPLRTPADLVGLRYGSYGTAIERPLIEALIRCGGGQGTIESIDIGFVEPFPLMARDQIDVVWLFYGWDGIRAEQSGLKLDFLAMRDYAPCVPDFYTPVLIAGDGIISTRPDVVAAFVQATARGYAVAIQEPARAADILLQAAPDLDAELVQASAAWLAGQFMADAPRWGEQNLLVWGQFTQFMVDTGILGAPITAATAFTNQFLPGVGK